MAYLVLESSVRTHRKFLAAGPAAAWLWVCGLGYCQEGLTDGFIPCSALNFLGVKGAAKLAERLVLAALWDVVDGGWEVHDYLQHNKSGDAVREIMRKRAEGGKKGGRPKTLEVTSEGTLKVNLTSQTPETLPETLSGTSVLPSGTSVLPGRLESDERPPEIVSGIAWRKPDNPESARYRRSEPLIQPVNEQRWHQDNHAVCFLSRGICVPLRLHFEFVGRLGCADADAKLRAWYPTVVASYEGRPFGDDLWQFWKNELAAWVGTVTSRPNQSGSRTGDSMDAAKVSLRRRLERLGAEDGHEDRTLESGEGSPDSQRHRALVQRPSGKALA